MILIEVGMKQQQNLHKYNWSCLHRYHALGIFNNCSVNTRPEKKNIIHSNFQRTLMIILLKKKNITSLTILFLGTQCVFSSYLQIGYLFTKQFERDGQIQYSDTEVIASYLFGTYWMWGLFILMISVFVLYKSYRYYLRN